MLRAIGLDRPEELFASVPEGLRIKKLDLAPGLSELALSREMRGVAAKNRVYRSIFRGAGAYNQMCIRDSYITKPFEIEERLARIRAALRKRATATAAGEGVLTSGKLALDPGRHTVRYGEEEVLSLIHISMCIRDSSYCGSLAGSSRSRPPWERCPRLLSLA